eukprot:21307-Heterococcus_DN1.PRE.1
MMCYTLTAALLRERAGGSSYGRGNSSCSLQQLHQPQLAVSHNELHRQQLLPGLSQYDRLHICAHNSCCEVLWQSRLKLLFTE